MVTSEYNVYYILPALTATFEKYLCCVPPFSAPVRALPPFRPRTNVDPVNTRDEQYAWSLTRCSIGAVALCGTVVVIDVDMRFEWSDEMLRCQKLILRPGP